MGESIDPAKLVSIAQVAKEFGYSRTQLSRVAAAGKIKAWRVGDSWVTTRELVEEYIRTNPKAGRPSRKPSKKRR